MPFELVFHGSGPILATWYAENIGNYGETFFCLAFFALLASMLIFVAKEPQSRQFAKIFIGKKEI